MTRSPIVWLVHPTQDNLTSISDLGEIRAVNNRYIFVDEIQNDQLLPSSFVFAMRQCVRQFRPDLDYLVLSGDHLQLVALAAELGRTYGSFRVLRWDRIARGYVVARVSTVE